VVLPGPEAGATLQGRWPPLMLAAGTPTATKTWRVPPVRGRHDKQMTTTNRGAPGWCRRRRHHPRGGRPRRFGHGAVDGSLCAQPNKRRAAARSRT